MLIKNGEVHGLSGSGFFSSGKKIKQSFRERFEETRASTANRSSVSDPQMQTLSEESSSS